MKLIQSMRKEYEAVQGAKVAQDDELKRLKERMLLGVSDVRCPRSAVRKI